MKHRLYLATATLSIALCGLMSFSSKGGREVFDCKAHAAKLNQINHRYWNGKDTSELAGAVLLMDTMLHECPDYIGSLRRIKIDYLCALRRYEDALSFTESIPDTAFNPIYTKEHTIYIIKLMLLNKKEEKIIYYKKIDSLLLSSYKNNNADTNSVALYYANRLQYIEPNKVRKELMRAKLGKELKEIMLNTYFNEEPQQWH